MNRELTFILLLASISLLSAQPAEFDFRPNYQSMSVVAAVEINGIPASGLDWIAAFDEYGICIGAAQLIPSPYYENTYLNLPVYGDDGTTPNIDEGINEGETFTFKLWVASSNEILENPLCISPVTGWLRNQHGTTITNWGFEDGVLLNFATAQFFQTAESEDIDCNVSVAINDYDEMELEIYPNPATTTLYITNAINYLNYEIFNSTGKLIEEEKNIKNKIDIQHLSNGIYVLKLQNDEHISIQQFIKN